MSKTKYDYSYDAVDVKDKAYRFGHRHVQVVLMFLVLFVCYAIRTAMSVAVLAMVDVSTNRTDIKVFDWDKKTQDVVLSSFYWGYATMQVPAGILAHRFGGSFLLSITMAVNGLVCMGIPWLSHIGGWQAMCACRMILGVTQGFLFPSFHTLLSKWVPVSERGRLTYLVYCGVSVGTVASQPLAGVMAGNDLGWPSIFYASGATALAVGIAWTIFGFDSPAKHKKISIDERTFIEASLNTIENTQKMPTPWKAILTSTPIWALLVTHMLWNWSFLIMLMETPSYMKHVLGINVKESGLLSGLPYIATWLLGLISSIFTDVLINKNIVSTLTSRKIWNIVGLWGPAAFMVLLCFLPPEKTLLNIIVLTAIIGLNGTTNAGFLLSYMDLSTNYAGITLALGNQSSNIIGILAPISAGFILNGHESEQSRWRIVFLSTAAVAFTANLSFMLFGKADEQPWNSYAPPKKILDVEMSDIYKKKETTDTTHTKKSLPDQKSAQ